MPGSTKIDDPVVTPQPMPRSRHGEAAEGLRDVMPDLLHWLGLSGRLAMVGDGLADFSGLHGALEAVLHYVKVNKAVGYVTVSEAMPTKDQVRAGVALVRELSLIQDDAP